jgi:hypothetical protein
MEKETIVRAMLLRLEILPGQAFEDTKPANQGVELFDDNVARATAHELAAAGLSYELVNSLIERKLLSKKMIMSFNDYISKHGTPAQINELNNLWRAGHLASFISMPINDRGDQRVVEPDLMVSFINLQQSIIPESHHSSTLTDSFINLGASVANVNPGQAGTNLYHSFIKLDGDGQTEVHVAIDEAGLREYEVACAGSQALEKAIQEFSYILTDVEMELLRKFANQHFVNDVYKDLFLKEVKQLSIKQQQANLMDLANEAFQLVCSTKFQKNIQTFQHDKISKSLYVMKNKSISHKTNRDIPGKLS